MKKVFLGLGILIGGSIIYFLLIKNVSTIDDNKNNIFAEYFKTKEMIDTFSEQLPKCVELNVILTKNLADNKIKQYENIELKYYFKKDKVCVKDINNLFSNGKIKFNYQPDEMKMKILKNNKIIKDKLIKKGFY